MSATKTFDSAFDLEEKNYFRTPIGARLRLYR